MKKYVIIGNGVAGAAAAGIIKKNDGDGSITIFSEEPEPFYYRPRLPEFMAGEVKLPRFTLQDRDWYSSRNIILRLSDSVAEVDTSSKVVKSEKGDEVSYEALLLATGARSFIPPIPGTEKSGVFALRNITDARAIAKYAQGVKEATLVGGGLLGLEAGYGLTRLGIKVNVVEFFDRLLPRQMDGPGSLTLKKILENMGFSFYLGAKVKEILGEKKARNLALEDGQILPGRMILFSAGIRPNLDLAQSMGLEVDKGLKVNDHLMTSQKGVWAAGDLIEFEGRIYGIWPAASAQGEIAGTNMTGGDAVYHGTVLSNSLKVAGVDLTSAGEIDPDEKFEAAVFEDEGVYRKIVLEDGRIKGFIFLGQTSGVKECQAALEQEKDIGSLIKEMGEKDFDFSKMT